jgi:N-acetylglucosaminyldiphosphoundecaprenol N-acetyl-beta-D-mannosaminyltransferase
MHCGAAIERMGAGDTVFLTSSQRVEWADLVGGEQVDLLGIRIDGLSQAATVGHILGCLERGEGGWLLTANVDILRGVFRNPVLRMLIQRADLVVADGTPIVWACRILGSPISGRVAGADLLPVLSEAAARVGRSVFLLGGEPGVADAAGRNLRAEFPGLDVRGGYSPPWGFEGSDQAIEGIVDALARAEPDIVFCGLGFPKQERLILKLTELFPHTWFLGSGASHTFVAGQFRRAPAWMQRCGLEWVHRLGQEPARLFRRYLLEDLPFALWLLTGAVLCRCVPKHSVLGAMARNFGAGGFADAHGAYDLQEELDRMLGTNGLGGTGNGHGSGNGSGNGSGGNGHGSGAGAPHLLDVNELFEHEPEWSDDDTD